MSVFFDSTLSSFICFIVSLAIFNYKKISYPNNLVFALIISLIVFIILIFILKRGNERKIKYREDKKLFE